MKQLLSFSSQEPEASKSSCDEKDASENCDGSKESAPLSTSETAGSAIVDNVSDTEVCDETNENKCPNKTTLNAEIPPATEAVSPDEDKPKDVSNYPWFIRWFIRLFIYIIDHPPGHLAAGAHFENNLPSSYLMQDALNIKKKRRESKKELELFRQVGRPSYLEKCLNRAYKSLDIQPKDYIQVVYKDKKHQGGTPSQV